MQLLSKFSTFGTAQFTRPIYLFSLINLTITIIFTTLLLAGCTSPAPGIRKFHLVTLTYNTEGSTKSEIFTDLSKVLSSDEGSNGTFHAVRVGYRGVCLETSPNDDDDNNKDTEWHCGATATEIAPDLGGDPLGLAVVADLFKDKISFSTPLWAALMLHAIAALLVVVNIVPVPIPAATRGVAAGMTGAGALVLLGAMALQQVTTGAIEKLVVQLGMNAVEVDVGNANACFGWAAAGTAVVAAVGVGAVWAAEMAAGRVRTKGEELMERGMEKASGGRVTMADTRDARAPGAPPKGQSLAANLIMKGVQSGTSTMNKKFGGRV